MAKKTYEEPFWIKLMGWVLFIFGVAGILFGIFSIIEPALRSEEEQAELEAVRAAENAERTAQYELANMQPRAIGAVSRLYYVQDSRTGICFATRASGHFGMLANVPCEDVPEDMLLTTELE
jgi:hypothetical protein